MRKKFLITGLIAIFAIVLFMKFHSNTVAPSDDTIWVAAKKVTETTLPLKAEVIGTLSARSVEISPEAAGHVLKIHFTDGSLVKSGEPLIQLDDAIYRAKFESAKAKYIYSKNNYGRMVFLGKRGAIAKQAIDQSESDLKEKKADMDEAEVLLKKMQLTAPFDGVVSKSKVNLGDYVTVGQSVVTLTDTNHLHIEYNISEKYLPLLKLNQSVTITTSAYPGEIFKGTVAYISPTINTDNRSVSLYAEIPNTQGKLAAGMFVNVKQSLGTAKHVLMIPARSIMPILDGEQVYKIVDGKAVAVTVEIGKRTENEVEVLQGLRKDDLIITDGQLKVKNGMPVKYKS